MASIRKRPDRDRPWQVRWRDPAGRQKSKSFVRKVDATRFRTKVEHEVLTSGYVDPHDRTTLRQFAEQWLERQCSTRRPGSPSRGGSPRTSTRTSVTWSCGPSSPAPSRRG